MGKLIIDSVFARDAIISRFENFGKDDAILAEDICNTTNTMKKISILFSLVSAFEESIPGRTIRLAADHLLSINEIRAAQADPGAIGNDILETLPEHWKRRTLFLKLILTKWDSILEKETNNKILDDKSHLNFDEAFDEHFKYICSSSSCNARIADLVTAHGGQVFNLDDSPGESTAEVTSFEVEDIAQEVVCVLDLIKENRGRPMAVAVTDEYFAELLHRNLRHENIEYSSYVFDNTMYLNLLAAIGNARFERKKPIDEIIEMINIENLNPEEVLVLNKLLENSIHYSEFTLCEFQQFFKEIIKFSAKPMPKVAKTLSIIGIEDLPFCSQETVVLPGTNEERWQSAKMSRHWIHPSVRRHLGLMTTEAWKMNTEADLMRLFGRVGRIILSRATKAAGALLRPSSIFSRIELKFKLSNHNFKKNFYKPKLNHHNQILSNINPIPFKFPEEISARDLPSLFDAPYTFYARRALNLAGQDKRDDRTHALTLFRSLLASHFDADQKAVDDRLAALENLDLIFYHKCIDAVDWLNRNRILVGDCVYHSPGEIALNINETNSVKILSRADMIMRAKGYATLVEFSLKSRPVVSEILHGSDCSLLMNAMIESRGGFGILGSLPRELQVWSFLCTGENPVEVTSIEISEYTLQSFEERIKALLQKYAKEDKNYFLQEAMKNKSNRYKHLMRI
jgi:RecB family exonuclease